MRGKIVIITLLGLLIMSLVLAACDDGMGKGIEHGEKRIVLGFSQIGAESVWRSANTKSIIEAAEESGIELKFQDAQQRHENQIKAIRAFIAQQVDVISFSPVVESGWDAVLKEAKDAGIPVIVADRTVDVKDDSLYVTVIGSDFTEEGRRCARWLVEKMKGVKEEVNIAEIQGTPGSAPAIDRKKGFEEILKDYPNFKIVKTETGDFLRSRGKEVMEEFLKDGDLKIDVLFAHNDDMALGAIEAMEEHGIKPGKDILIVSVDASRLAFEAMIAGKLNCTVECNPLIGPQLMKAVRDVVEGKTLPKRIFVEESVFPAEVAAEELPNRKY